MNQYYVATLLAGSSKTSSLTSPFESGRLDPDAQTLTSGIDGCNGLAITV
jgi:hypothetical protein